MKRKYYMRGLGFGILITAILCAVVLPKKTEPMTDAEVIARAKELGYEKAEGVTADDINKLKENEKLSGTPGATDVPDDTPEGTKDPKNTPEPTLSPVPTPEPPEPPDKPDAPEIPATPTPAPEKKPTAAPTPDQEKNPTAMPTSKPTVTPTKKPTATTTPDQEDSAGKDSYSITVERGMTATKVAERLAGTGAISDVNEFISYLKKNNLTDFINIGKFTIPKGASYKEIAHILTGK